MCLALSLCFCEKAPAWAFHIADVDGALDSTLSVAAFVRTDRQDPSLVGIANGGTARSVNGDDGDLNYHRGEWVSTRIRADEDLQLRWRRVGVYARGSYDYDPLVAATGSKFGPKGGARLRNRAQLYDLFVATRFEPWGHFLALRIGQQPIDWGSATFIPNGINTVDALDLTQLRQPGAQLRDARLPSPAILASLELTSTLSLSAYALARFDSQVLDPDGAFFSTSDFAGDDGNHLVLGAGRRGDGHFPATGAADADVYIARDADRRPKGPGQFGLALRQLIPALRDAEVSLYMLRTDSHLPFVSFTKQAKPTPTSGSSAGDGSARYFLDYPHGIDVYGVSVSAPLPAGLALEAEYSFRPRAPLQLPVPDLVLSSLGLSSQVAPEPGTISPGSEIAGWRAVAVYQLQFTLSRVFAHPGLGASQLRVLSEVGADDLVLPGNLKFNGPGVVLPSRPIDASTSNGSFQNTGFATRYSWGYRIVFQASYPGAFGGLSLQPRLAYSADVKGVGPTFNEGAQAITTALSFEYLVNWHAELGYTAFFGGRNYSGVDTVAVPGQPPDYATSANPLRDRDFVSIDLSYSF